ESAVAVRASAGRPTRFPRRAHNPSPGPGGDRPRPDDQHGARAARAAHPAALPQALADGRPPHRGHAPPGTARPHLGERDGVHLPAAGGRLVDAAGRGAGLDATREDRGADRGEAVARLSAAPLADPLPLLPQDRRRPPAGLDAGRPRGRVHGGPGVAPL
ncbi:MAG: hypothetical protein AVDCRST_MAG79-2876, partial [uncultured Thermoleophilia bacterium]